MFRKKLRSKDLHSNMVRFIIGNQSAAGGMTTLFTFQYG